MARLEASQVFGMLCMSVSHCLQFLVVPHTKTVQELFQIS